MGDHVAGLGQGQQARDAARDPLPALDRPALFGVHLLHRLQGNSGEYKVMGLAPYGEPKYKELILDKLIDLKADGSFRLDLSYFDYCTGLTMTNERFSALFGEPVRAPDKLLTKFHMDVAASVQAVLDEVVLRLTRGLAKKAAAKNLCVA